MGALGHGGHGKHKNRASGGDLGSCRPGFGTYGRGNLPGHDVFGVLSKMLKIACRWMQIGSDGCNRVCGHGEQQKQGKKSVNWVSRACFVMYVHNAKKRKWTAMAILVRGDHLKEWRVSKRFAVRYRCL